MGYYRGDYYRGDYYRGDPGLFSSIGKFLGGAARGISRVVGSVVPGPIGMLARAITPPAGAGGRVSFFPPEPSIPNPLGFANVGPPVGFPGAGGGGGSQLPAVIDSRTGQLCLMKGTRANKSTYITRGGGTSHWPNTIIVHPKGTECVRTRRMNVANPRALRRAIRRTAGFVKLARRAHVKLQAFTGKAKARKKK